ncbi:MAG TPA: ABC transporter permease subunit/CPBP intramembrane protease [Actinomycetota bacterium]|nr:ABC transporter permease subunit/CPBP intramembrane protease [Actinomycetota bacterium]
MRLRTVTSIVRKELLETLRDRRTLFAMVALPALLYPLLFIVMGAIFTSNAERVEAQTATVVLWGPVPAPVQDEVSRIERPRVRVVEEEAPPRPAASARSAIEAGTAHVVVLAEPEADARFTGGGSARVRVMSSHVKPLSRRAGAEVADALDRVGDRMLAERVSTFELPEGFEVPLAVSDVDVSTQEQRGGDLLGRMLPMMLLMMVTIGATYPAVDLTAGEKERGTMQTLLVSPVRPVEIIAGKYVTVLAVAVMSAAVNLGAMGLSLGRMTAGLPSEAGAIAVSPRLCDFAWVLALLVPTACLLAAVLMVVSVFARTFREGQTYGTPVMIAAMMAGFAAWSDMELGPRVAFVPLVNVSLVLRDLFRQELVGSTLFLVFLSTSLYAIAAIVATARVFESEQVLLSGERPWRDVAFRRLGRSIPSGRSALLFAVVLFVLVYYGSLLASGRGFVTGVLVTQVGLLLVPALVWTLAGRHDLRQTLALRWPSARALGGIALTAAGGWALSSAAGRVASLVFPGAADYYRSLGEAIGAGTAGLGIGTAILLLAVAPAVSEEVCFRGVVLSGLRSTGTAAGAVIGSALLFGAFHMSLFHAVPAAAAGVVLALAVLWSGSLLAGLGIHLVNNSIAVLAVRRPDLVASLESPVAIAAGLALLVAGLAVLRSASRTPEEVPAARAFEEVR